MIGGAIIYQFFARQLTTHTKNDTDSIRAVIAKQIQNERGKFITLVDDDRSGKVALHFPASKYPHLRSHN